MTGRSERELSEQCFHFYQEKCVDVVMCDYTESERNICVIIFVAMSPLPLHELVKHLELLRIGI